MGIKLNDGCFEESFLMPGEANDASSSGQRKPDKALRRRTRTPLSFVLQLHSDPEPNRQHPLAGLDPEVRGQQREQLISSILARLATGRSSLPATISRMDVEPKVADSETSPEAE